VLCGLLSRLSDVAAQADGAGAAAPPPPAPAPEWTNKAPPPGFCEHIKFTTENVYSKRLPKGLKEKMRRYTIKGVEIRELPAGHVLCGEKGLFATRKFEMCDIVGEYCGRVVDDETSGHYVAALEDKLTAESVGLDGGECGSECRYINCYIGIGDAANVAMKTVYVSTYPHIAIGTDRFRPCTESCVAWCRRRLC
jgi:hypothetical protein